MSKDTDKDAVSYFSEHTAEFALVPRIVTILKRRFPLVVPMYFWKTREGNGLSERIHKRMHLRILAMFPRRPKVRVLSAPILHGKLNRSLFKFAESASQSGVPTIAGFPLAGCLAELTGECLMMWMRLMGDPAKDVLFEVHRDAPIPNMTSADASAFEVIDDDGLLSLVTDRAAVMRWPDALRLFDLLRTLRRSDSTPQYSYPVGGYMPTYFLIID